MNITERSVVTLREITKATVWKILKLKTSDDQRQFVASNAESIAEAYFQKDYAWFRAIYADECPVGFMMLGLDPKDDFCFLWRFMIDKKYQRKGFGKKAIALLFEHLKTQTTVLSVITSYHKASGDPSDFYREIGFVEADEVAKRSELYNHILKAGEIGLQMRLS